MTVVQPNSISGINSITVQSGEALSVHKADGTLIRTIVTDAGISTFSDVSIADKIIHTGDTNTAIRFPAADTVTIETAGSERLRVSGVGTVMLRANQGSAETNIIRFEDTDTSAAANQKFGQLQWFSNDASGAGACVKGEIFVAAQDTTPDGYMVFATHDGGSSTVATERMRISSDGKIGINTTAGTLLELKGESSKEADVTFNRQPVQGTNDGVIGQLLFENATDSVAQISVKRESAADDAYIQFATQATGGGMTERLRIDSSGQVLINGGNDARSNFHGGGTTYRLQVESTSFETSAPAFICNSNTAGHGPHVTLARSRGTSVGSNTIVQDDDVVGVINFQGNDGTHFENVARIRAEIDGAPATNDMPGRLTFFTVADGSVSPTERLRITSTGRIGININNPDSYNSAGNNLVLGDTGNNSGMTIVTSTTNNGHIFFADGTASGAQNRGIIKYEHGNDAMAFNTAETERLRLTSGGDLLVGHGSVISNMKFGGSGDFGSHAEIIGANKGFANGLAILNYDASATIPALLKLATSRSDTNGTNTAVGDNDNCGGIQFMGNDGTRFIDVARIDGVTDGAPGANDMPGRLMFLTTADGGSVVTERMRITSTGKIRIKCADFDADPSSSNAGLQLFDTSGGAITSASSVTTGSSHAVFHNPNGVVGQIQTSGSGTTYATSSDYRLKENVADLTGAIARVKQLAPKRFNFIADDTTMVDGFLAHEAQTVVPEAVTGTHNEVDGDGNPVIQGIDQAKLVPLLTAALKEAITKIETLEAQVAAL